MAVLSWCSDFLVNSVCARDLGLLSSVKYDSSLISSWRDFVCRKYPFSATLQVNSFLTSAIFLMCAVTVFNFFRLLTNAVTVFSFSNHLASAATLFFGISSA